MSAAIAVNALLVEHRNAMIARWASESSTIGPDDATQAGSESPTLEQSRADLLKERRPACLPAMLKSLDRIISILEPIVFVGFLGIWIFCLVNLIRRGSRRKTIVTMIVGGGSIVVMMILGSIMTACARRDLLNFLDGTNGPFTVSVQGREVRGVQADSLITLLRSVRHMAAHHSHPEGMVAIRIVGQSGRATNLALGRDSAIPREYWVFQTDYATTSNNEIGRVVTALLDDF